MPAVCMGEERSEPIRSRLGGLPPCKTVEPAGAGAGGAGFCGSSPPFLGKTTTLPSHKLQDEATPLPKHLVGLQQEPPRELELEPCQQALHEYACHQTVKKVGSA